MLLKATNVGTSFKSRGRDTGVSLARLILTVNTCHCRTCHTLRFSGGLDLGDKIKRFCDGRQWMACNIHMHTFSFGTFTILFLANFFPSRFLGFVGLFQHSFVRHRAFTWSDCWHTGVDVPLITVTVKSGVQSFLEIMLKLNSKYTKNLSTITGSYGVHIHARLGSFL